MYFELEQDKFFIEGGLYFVRVKMVCCKVEHVGKSGVCSDVFGGL